MHVSQVGRAAIATAYAKQQQLRTAGRFRLRSRHHLSNLSVLPLPTPGCVRGCYYLTNYRNPDSDSVMNQGPAIEPLHGPAFVGEYRFEARRVLDDEATCGGGEGWLWLFSKFEEQHHFSREALPVNGRLVGPSSSTPDNALSRL